MALVVLTTQTPHHAYFVRELTRDVPVAACLLETRPVSAPYPTAHPFEGERDLYERELWFGGGGEELSDHAECHRVERCNDAVAVALLTRLRPRVTVVFGTARLSPAVIAAAGEIVNLHGGDPRDYRGLDTHLWAVWHDDFDGLVTTLHDLTAELDAGAIVGHGKVPLRPGMRLAELRAANTELCLALTRRALAERRRDGRFIAVPQRRKGRYYSFMPTALKEACVRKFKRHTERLR